MKGVFLLLSWMAVCLNLGCWDLLCYLDSLPALIPRFDKNFPRIIDFIPRLPKYHKTLTHLTPSVLPPSLPPARPTRKFYPKPVRQVFHNFAFTTSCCCCSASRRTLRKILPLALFGICSTNLIPPLSCL